jgi:FKBP-type peptidyl-prolyl cis-trans isomerase FklB
MRVFQNAPGEHMMARHIWIFALAAAFLTVTAAAQNAAELKTQKEKISYALGMQMGGDFHKQDLDLDIPTLMKGLEASYKGSKTLLTDDEMHAALVEAKEEYQKKQAALREEKAQVTLKEGEKFLAENKNKEGVVTLPDGLQYKILEQGKGNKPRLHDHVLCNYRGMLLDGTQFDSSERHNGPATFPIRGVLPGWEEALLMMPVGSKWELFVPPALAYGEQGAKSMNVPPNATLIFELELVAVKENEAEERDRD